MSPDDEFDDFLRRRRTLFERPRDDDLEPPAEIDRLVLRQAREAIESAPAQRVFRAPRWGLPVALAATLVIAFSVILRVTQDTKVAESPVAVQNVSREVNPAAATPAVVPPPAVAAEAPQSNGSIVVDLTTPQEKSEESMARRVQQPAPARDALAKQSHDQPFVSDAEGRRYAEPPPPPFVVSSPAPAAAEVEAARTEMSATVARSDAAAAPAAPPANTPKYRLDSKTWIAEIDRLRAAGDYARADAELAEYKRQHRAYAGAPDQ